jgi:hypothetical protein
LALVPTWRSFLGIKWLRHGFTTHPLSSAEIEGVELYLFSLLVLHGLFWSELASFLPLHGFEALYLTAEVLKWSVFGGLGNHFVLLNFYFVVVVKRVTWFDF